MPKEPVVEHPVVIEHEPEPQPEPEPQQQQQQLQRKELSQPDVIPQQRESVPPPEIIETLPPPAAFGNAPEELPRNSHDTNGTAAIAPPIIDEQIYSNVGYDQQAEPVASHQNPISEEDQMAYVTALIGDEQHDLSKYIENTGIKAIALYDYQATAEDEISFDPNDIITHIERVWVMQNATLAIGHSRAIS